ncbi:hypothetical protein AB1Y20_005379 [Prymnesium parvum]|uniref:Zinc finger PHD-type domain-containing protein n=1 Tax=Prymnesium parvum TaxID=97485 RepID=A0AB34J5L4_PRYPA
MALDEGVWSVGLQVKLLVSEKEGQEKHARELEHRLQQAHNLIACLRDEARETQLQLREAQRRQQEAEQQSVSQKQAAEDQCSRHALALRMAGETSRSTQSLLSQQGQELHQLRSLLRGHEAELARLKIEKEGASELAASLQQRVEEVSRALGMAVRSEECFKAALHDVRKEHEAMWDKLRACEDEQKKLAPVHQLEAALRAEREKSARTQASLEACAHDVSVKEEEIASLRQENAARQQALAHADHELQKRHDLHLRSEETASSLTEQLQYALQRTLRSAEAHENLTRKAAHDGLLVELLLRELAHADAHAHAAQLCASLEQKEVDARLRKRLTLSLEWILIVACPLSTLGTDTAAHLSLPPHDTYAEAAEARVDAFRMLTRGVAAELDEAREKLCEQLKANAALEQQLDGVAFRAAAEAGRTSPARDTAPEEGCLTDEDATRRVERNYGIEQETRPRPQASLTPLACASHSVGTATGAIAVLRDEPEEVAEAPRGDEAASESLEASEGVGEDVRRCSQCHDVLYGARSTCVVCGSEFHARCCNRSAQELNKNFTCSSCTPKRAAASLLAGSSKRRKGRRFTSQQQSNVLSMI